MEVIKKQVPQWLIDVQTKVFERKTLKAKEKYNQYSADAIEALKELFDIYFRSYDFEDEAENQSTFDILNKEWKQYCQNVMVTKSKYIKMQYDAFERQLTAYLDSEEGKEYLSKLKEKQVEFTPTVEVDGEPKA